MRRTLVSAASLVVLLALGSIDAAAGEPSTFRGVTADYEAVRQALLHDSVEGIDGAAKHMQRLLDGLESDLTAEHAGVRPGSEEGLRPVLSEIRAKSAELIDVHDVANARRSFAGLSRAMVQYRQLAVDPAPVVAFCSMLKEVWLQPKGEIGNPYYGQSMPRCGEFVSE